MSFWGYKMLWPDNAMMSLKYSNFKICLNVGSTKILDIEILEMFKLQLVRYHS